MAETDFDQEVFEYWIPRLVADGVDANDIQSVRPKVKSWNDWPDAWASIGKQHLQFAKEQETENNFTTAGEAFVKASLCYHVGQVVAGKTPEKKKELQIQKEFAFEAGSKYLLPPAHKIEIDFNGVSLPGYLRLPPNGGKPTSCVILVPGLDSTKEDFITLSEMCIRRNLASFAFDGPGQGEVHKHLTLSEGYENSILSVFEEISSKPEIDPNRIGLLGRSLGGYFILRAAAKNPAIASLAVFGGCYDLSDWNNMPKTILDGFLWATGSTDYDKARKLMGAATLDDCLSEVNAPTIVVHGKRDAIFHYTQAEKIIETLGEQAEGHIAEDGVHCCHNYSFRYRNLMADWFVKTL